MSNTLRRIYGNGSTWGDMETTGDRRYLLITHPEPEVWLEDLVRRYCFAYESYMERGGMPPADAIRETLCDLREELERI